MLRSCYTAKMRFYPSRPDVETEIQWYFVPDNRPALPIGSAFASRIYDREEEPQPEIGELFNPVPWRGGLPPRPVSDGGYCGTLRQWYNGLDYPPPPIIKYPGTLIPICCNPPIETAIGGEVVSGDSFASITTNCCPDDPVPVVMIVECTQVLADCSATDGIQLPCINDGSLVPCIPEIVNAWITPAFDMGGVMVRVVFGCSDVIPLFFWGSLVSEDLQTQILPAAPGFSQFCPQSIFHISWAGVDVGTCLGIWPSFRTLP